ncbi:MAG: hypothetical protein JNL73_09470 [Anaerolineales bacterium]|nr:hypothetical protein [Anaerolineales bacterium]
MTEHHQWFSVNAPGFDTAEVQARVVKRMLQRSPEGFMETPDSEATLEDFAESLAGLKSVLDSLSVQVAVRDERLPIGNATWNRIKTQFHALTVLYVNELAGRQAVINTRIVAALDALLLQLTAEAAQRDNETRALELEIARLNALVAKLSRDKD